MDITSFLIFSMVIFLVWHNWPQKKEATSRPRPPEDSKNKKTGWVIPAIIAICVIAGGGIYYFRGEIMSLSSSPLKKYALPAVAGIIFLFFLFGGEWKNKVLEKIGVMASVVGLSIILLFTPIVGPFIIEQWIFFLLFFAAVMITGLFLPFKQEKKEKEKTQRKVESLSGLVAFIVIFAMIVTVIMNHFGITSFGQLAKMMTPKSSPDHMERRQVAAPPPPKKTLQQKNEEILAIRREYPCIFVETTRGKWVATVKKGEKFSSPPIKGSKNISQEIYINYATVPDPDKMILDGRGLNTDLKVSGVHTLYFIALEDGEVTISPKGGF